MECQTLKPFDCSKIKLDSLILAVGEGRVPVVRDLMRAVRGRAAAGIAISGPDYVDRPNQAGRIMPPLQEARIVDEKNNEVPRGTIGELSVRGPNMMRCYHNKPEATAETLIDGWLLSGDLGIMDEDGYVTIVDRAKNIIIRGGENISCLEVEAAIHQHPAVGEAAVFACPDDRYGEVVGAIVWLKEDAAGLLDAGDTFTGLSV